MNLYEYQRSRSFRFNIFFSLDTARPIESKFHVEPPWDGGKKVNSNGPSHMPNMAVMRICGKKPLKIFFYGTKRPMTLNIGMQHQVLEYFHVCSNDDTGWSLAYFTARSKLVPYSFVWEKGKTMDFSETVVVW